MGKGKIWVTTCEIDKLRKEFSKLNLIGVESAKIRSKYIWECEHGHSYTASIHDRRIGSGCPYCSNKKIILNENDLASTHPDIAKEWHPIKNGRLLPNEVVAGSGKSVWWICQRGHEWESIIRSRAIRGHGCKLCCGGQTSYVEQTIYLALKGIWDATYNREMLFGYEYDVYVKDIGVVIEYDGGFYHSTKKKAEMANKKKEAAEENGLQMVRVIEHIAKDNIPLRIDCEALEIEYTIKGNKYDNAKYVCACIEKLLSEAGIADILHKMCVGQEVSNMALANSKKVVAGQTFGDIHPEMIDYWDTNKNGGLTPFDFPAGSGTMVWFKCPKCGGEYIQYIRRAHKGCRVCGKNIKTGAAGINDLASIHPELIKDWDFELNGELRPDEVRPASQRRAHWVCHVCGYMWETMIAHRARNGSGCPNCGSGKKKKEPTYTSVAEANSKTT